VVDILARIDKDIGEGPPEEEMGLESPVTPEWRVARLSIGYQEQRDLFVLELTELLPDEDGEEAEGEGGEGEPTGLEAIGPALVVEIEEVDPSVEPVAVPEEEPDQGSAVLPDDAEIERAIEALSGGSDAGSDTQQPNQVRLWASREQMLSLARHGAAVSARGRPRCQFCNQPMDPEGHVCSAMNGHRALDE
jgi:hypothetical protein